MGTLDHMNDAYDRGFDDGVEYVLGMMDSYVNRLALIGEMYPQARACEDMLEDVRNTIDEQ